MKNREPADAGHPIVPVEVIERRIYLIRGQKVMLDAGLADIYGVSTKRLNEQVKRNRSRFPKDFMFRLTGPEVQQLNRSQIATGSQKHRDPRFPPYAFTEHGAVMLASVLNSQVAVRASIVVGRDENGTPRPGWRHPGTQDRDLAPKPAGIQVNRASGCHNAPPTVLTT